jgi:hypothetical protein
MFHARYEGMQGLTHGIFERLFELEKRTLFSANQVSELQLGNQFAKFGRGCRIVLRGVRANAQLPRAAYIDCQAWCGQFPVHRRLEDTARLEEKARQLSTAILGSGSIKDIVLMRSHQANIYFEITVGMVSTYCPVHC